MATLQITLPGNIPGSAAVHATVTHPTLGTVILPITRPATNHGEVAIEWGKTERPQRDPLLLRKGNRLPVYTLDVVLVGPDYSSDQAERILALLRQMAASPSAVVVSWGGLESGTYQITSLTGDSVRRVAGSNRISQEEVKIEFTASTSLPPVPGQPPPPAPAPSTAGPAASAPQQRRYTVKAGDTLSGISQAMYGTTLRWRDIAAANNVTDPRKLQIGQVLVIPA
jgi:LysM repeat protein